MSEVKYILHPETGKKFFLGARITEMEAHPAPRFSLENYLAPTLPNPPGRLSYFNYGHKDPSERQVFGNDRVGNCVEADLLHALGVINYNAGRPVSFTDDQGIALYSDVTGYVPGDSSTDRFRCDPCVGIKRV